MTNSRAKSLAMTARINLAACLESNTRAERICCFEQAEAAIQQIISAGKALPSDVVSSRVAVWNTL